MMEEGVSYSSTESYSAGEPSNVEVLFNIKTKESYVSEGTNLTLKQARDLLPGCTHIMLRHEGRFTYYKIGIDYTNGVGYHGWTHIDHEDNPSEVPPELYAFQMIL